MDAEATTDTTAWESGEQLRLAIEASPTGMIMVDHRGTIVMLNAQAERLFGYERTELLGRPIELLVPVRARGEHPAFRASFFGDLRARPMGAGRDLFGMRKDGSEIPIEIGLNPFETARGTFVLSSIVDITERHRHLAQITASLAEKETLLHEIHHRVKNSLQMISSLLNLQADASPAAREALLQSQARIQAIAMVHEGLYRSQSTSHIDFDAYLRELIGHTAHAHLAANRDICFEIDVSRVRLGIDRAVPCGLLVSELVTNALKHAFEGRRTGKVIVQLSKDEEGMVSLVVADDGIGLPPSVDLDTLDGKTLGLDLVQTFAKQLGANVVVERTEGTRYQFTFEGR